MKPFRNVILDPPPDNAGWDTAVKEHHLHHKWPKQLRQMYRSHKRKAIAANKERLDRINFPGKFLFELSEQGITGQAATDALAEELAYWTWKADKLRTIVKCCRVEHEIRKALQDVGRDVAEPDDGKEAEPELPAEAMTITSVDETITRNPVGYS